VPGRIGIDGRNLQLEHGTGIATYGRALSGVIDGLGFRTATLISQAERTRISRWATAALTRSSQAVPVEGGWGAADMFRVAQVHFDLWGGLRRIRGDAPALMHWTSPLPLRFEGCPNIVTVHDLIPLLHPGLTGTDGARLRRMLARIMAQADHVLTVSDATRQDVVRHLGADPARVTNTWQSVTVDGAAATPPAGLVPGGYWLHVGTVERRKNLVRLIQAWRASGVAGPLVLAGPDGWQAAEVSAERAGDPGIVRLEWLARADLLALVRDARALLLPSLAEGFGLPLAEAMALGTPALIAGGGAMAEVAGGAALEIDPRSTRSMAEGMAALDREPELRQRLAACGLVRAALFTPAAFAARLEPVYRAVLSAPAARR
jgi:glycosyltransferase involved in cell wall biosynthesis